MEPITILIVDDHAIVRHGVRTFLSIYPDLQVVEEADSGEAAVLYWLLGISIPIKMR